MSRIRKTARAEADIRSILLWITRGSEDAALRWIRGLHEELLKIVETPGIGTDRSDLRPGLRTLAYGNYLIFFKATRSGITIVRVLHGARDYPRYFKKD